MPTKDRSAVIPVATGVQVLYTRSSSHPVEYAITLRVIHEGSWHTIYLVDNAHGFDEHHAHAYVDDCKQPPDVFGGKTNIVMNNAITTLTTFWREIYDAWKQTQ